MTHSIPQNAAASPRRPTHLTVPANPITEARRTKWLAENHAAIKAYNERIEKEGLTLAAYRQF